ncbi:MAG: hypothetical protein DI640_13105 [Sphingomonas taxi]|uniref:Uncharacterized protein n=1 Tax=Sphingomonas taxi TaxID=1549858 RepID=A0A2W4YRY8_9SPHN|nr:MAG: hypothetical protein DI640_13105 [Sphingomonas taxi]
MKRYFKATVSLLIEVNDSALAEAEAEAADAVAEMLRSLHYNNTTTLADWQYANGGALQPLTDAEACGEFYEIMDHTNTPIDDGTEPTYYIQQASFSDDDVKMRWSNKLGWVDPHMGEHDLFTQHERNTLTLPIGGEWVQNPVLP